MESQNQNKHKLQLSHVQYKKQNCSIANSMLDIYIIFQKIGDGSLGDVYRGMNDITKKEVAIKIISLYKYKNTPNQSYLKKATKNQIENLNKLNSEHIVKLYDVYSNKDFRILVMQYCNGPTLTKYIHDKVQNRIPQEEALDILKQLIIGLSEMHLQRMIHRDLKTDNIMFHHGVVKILDLGFSKIMKQKTIYKQTLVGTPLTMAPQVMNGDKYGLKADIWSLGVILYNMVYGIAPFQPKPLYMMYQHITTKHLFPNQGKVNNYRATKAIQDLMQKMLVVDQSTRLDWSGLSSHKVLFNDKIIQLPEDFHAISKVEIQSYIQQSIQKCEQDLEDVEDQNEIQTSDVNISTLMKINEQYKELKRTQIDRTEIQQYNILNDYYLDCKKTWVIIYHIIIPIENSNALNMNNRKVIQMMYLIASRCYFNLLFLREDIRGFNSYKIKKLKQQVKNLQKLVYTKFNQYSKKLTQTQSKLLNYVSDGFLKVFQRSCIQHKDKFLVGVEATDSPTLNQYRKTRSKTLTSQKLQQKLQQKTQLKVHPIKAQKSTSHTKYKSEDIYGEDDPKNKKNKSTKQIGDKSTILTKNSEIKTYQKRGYCKTQQIYYTQKYYIDLNKPKINKKFEKLHLYLQKYSKINLVRRQDLGNQNFEDWVRQIIEIEQQ